MSDLFDLPPGGPDGFVRWLLHNDGTALATGYRVQQGNGTATPLYLSNAGVGVVNGGGFRCLLVSGATAHRTITLGDGDGVVLPVLRSVLAADFTTASSTAAAVGSFGIPVAGGGTPGIEPGGLYEFEMVLLTTEVVSGVMIRPAITGPTPQTVFTAYEVEYLSVNTLTSGSSRVTQQFATWGTVPAFITTLTGGEIYRIRVSGTCKFAAGALSAGIGLQVASEANTSNVRLKAGSWMTFRKLN
jgi:hypothetical protein